MVRRTRGDPSVRAHRGAHVSGAEKISEARSHLILALDAIGLEQAHAMARRLAPWFGTVKVGLELYAAIGPSAFASFAEEGFKIFADLKYHDIPTTVERAARACARHPVDFVNFHAAGGTEMLAAGVAGLAAGADDVGRPRPVALAVTVLTSARDATAFEERLEWARIAGCDGVVCAGAEVVRARAVGLTTMVPGVRLPGGDTHDQARVTTPGDAIRAGANWLVVGRAVTAADDPESSAAQVAAAVDAAREATRPDP